jgi:hypothetical protein
LGLPNGDSCHGCVGHHPFMVFPSQRVDEVSLQSFATYRGNFSSQEVFLIRSARNRTLVAVRFVDHH